MAYSNQNFKDGQTLQADQLNTIENGIKNCVSLDGSEMTGPLQIKQSNPYVMLTDTGSNNQVTYLQAYENKIGIGTGWTTSLKVDGDGNVYIKGKLIFNTTNGNYAVTISNGSISITAV